MFSQCLASDHMYLHYGHMWLFLKPSDAYTVVVHKIDFILIIKEDWQAFY